MLLFKDELARFCRHCTKIDSHIIVSKIKSSEAQPIRAKNKLSRSINGGTLEDIKKIV